MIIPLDPNDGATEIRTENELYPMLGSMVSARQPAYQNGVSDVMEHCSTREKASLQVSLGLHIGGEMVTRGSSMNGKLLTLDSQRTDSNMLQTGSRQYL